MLVTIISFLHLGDTRIRKKNLVNYPDLSGLSSFAVTFKVSRMLAKLNQLIYCLINNIHTHYRKGCVCGQKQMYILDDSAYLCLHEQGKEGCECCRPLFQ